MTSLEEQRRGQADDFNQLKDNVINLGLSKLTGDEFCRLEALHQLSINGEFNDRNNEGSLQALEKKRLNALQERVEEGKPPFENTHSPLWQWDEKINAYRWTGKIKPIGFESKELLWKPEEINKPNPHGPEGNPQSRL